MEVEQRRITASILLELCLRFHRSGASPATAFPILSRFGRTQVRGVWKSRRTLSAEISSDLRTAFCREEKNRSIPKMQVHYDFALESSERAAGIEPQSHRTDRLPHLSGEMRDHKKPRATSTMRNIFAWILVVLGLMLAVSGVGMIIIGLLTNHADVSLAGGVWAVLGAVLTFAGFRLRVVRFKADRN
jgi:hypothetical protein